MGAKSIDPRYSAAFQRSTATDPGAPSPGSMPRSAAPSRRDAHMASTSASAETTPRPAAADSADAEPVDARFHETARPDADDFAGGSDSDVSETHHGGRSPFRYRRLLWTIAFFVIGIGLCLASYACYSEFNLQRWTNATPISGTDQWVISDGTGYGTRTVDQFEVLFPRYMSQMAIWIGAVGVATIVMNLFRIAPGATRRR